MNRLFSTAATAAVNVTMRGSNAIVAMNRAPANLLNREFLVELNDTFKKIEADSAVKGVVLTSALPRIFSGGIDIAELYQPRHERLASFWSSLQDLWLTLYGLRKPSVAAINGAAPAGGCMLALCCDERVMLSSAGSIGLNETKLGIVAPLNIFALPFQRTVGHRHAERALQTGALYKPSEALAIGLVDRVVDSAADLDAEVERALASYLAVPSRARHEQKMLLRGDLLARQRREREADVASFISLITDEKVQANLGAYVAALKQKK